MKLINTLALLLCCFVAVRAGEKVNLSGVWTLDQEKSFSNGPGFEQTMTISQNGDQVKLAAKQKTPRGETEINEEYLLNSQEVDFVPQTPPNAKGKRKAMWLPNGRGILIEDRIDDGKAARNITRKLTLSADGKVLIVDLFIDDQRGSFELKRVYNKAG